MRKISSLFIIMVIAVSSLTACKKEVKKVESVAETETKTETNTMYEAIFFDVKGNSFDPQPDAVIENESRELEDLSLTSDDDFWGDKRQFFMHALGVIEIDTPGTYYFKLTASGSGDMQLNNVGLIGWTESGEKTSNTGSRKLDAGYAVFDFQYYPQEFDPYFNVEWSTDGENFEAIPADKIKSAAVQRKTPISDADSNGEDNTLTEEEINEGWKLLFDGESTAGWHTYGAPGEIGSRWKAIDGALVFEGYDRFAYHISGVEFQRGPLDKTAMGGRDIVSDEAFENFELLLDWKISKNGNSGIFYTVQEDPEYSEGWKTSPEMQILDNVGQKDGLINTHRAGDLYDLISCSEIRVKPHDTWNRVKIVKNQGKVEHWLNGVQVVSYDMNSEAFMELFRNSKFSNLPNFINPGPGRISLQDHDNRVAFKNIKIKLL